MERVLVSYGCGRDGKEFLRKCNDNNIVVDYVCDGNIDLVGNIFCGYEVMSFDNLRNDLREKIIIVSSRTYYYEIVKELKPCVNSVVMSMDVFFYLYRINNSVEDMSSFDEKTNNIRYFENLDSYIRSKRKICLFADSNLLAPDQNAGNKASLCYIKALVKQGWNVVFYSSLANYSPKDAIRLEELGCFVLWGYNRKKLILDYLLKNVGHIGLFFINRPEVFKELHDSLKMSKSTIIYFGHDVHFLRLKREFEITGNELLIDEINRMKNLEYDCIKRSTLAGYPSHYEVELLKRELPQSNIKYLPLYSYKERELFEYDEGKNGIMFVGGFLHRPNIDAVKWFCDDILPIIRKAGNEDVFYIIGSNPNKEIYNLGSRDVKVMGFVTDDELLEFYKKCRLAVIPLRYGAGMKGKLLEAMYNGIPVVTTSIGAEGLMDCEKCFEVADDAIGFADKVSSITNDLELAKQISLNAQAYIRDNFNEEKFDSYLEGYI